MTLWDEVGGRLWSDRAGPRSAVAEIDVRPAGGRRGRRVRQVFRRPLPSGRAGWAQE